MNQHVQRMIAAFFEAIEPWESAYAKARLTFIAVKRDDVLVISAARLYLSAVFRNPTKDLFEAGDLVAGQVELTGGVAAFVQAIEQMASPDGFAIPDLGNLALRPEDNQNIIVGAPDLLHADGLNQGNRLAVLVMSGARRDLLTPQPQTDWMLKAAIRPFDSLAELSVEYELGAAPNTQSILESWRTRRQRCGYFQASRTARRIWDFGLRPGSSV